MALVQEWTPAPATNASSDITGTATTVGSFLHVTVTIRTSADIVAVSDTSNGTWPEVPSHGNFSGSHVRHFYMFNAASVSTVTVDRTPGDGTIGAVFLREFDDAVDALLAHNGADNPNTGQPPPCQVTFTETGVLVIGSLGINVTTRTLTLQNTTEFSELATREAGQLETMNAYGVLDTGTYGPDWDITSGSVNQLTGSVTSAFAASGGGGSSDLGVDEVRHGHTADVVALTQAHNVAIEDASHGHAADSVPVTQVHHLVVASAAHGHTADSVTLTGLSEIDVHETTHGHTTETVSVTQLRRLLVDSASHGHVVDAVILTQVHQIVVDSSVHGHTADQVTVVDTSIEIPDMLTLTVIRDPHTLDDATEPHVLRNLTAPLTLDILED